MIYKNSIRVEEFTDENKNKVLAVYPNAYCMKTLDKNGAYFRIFYEEEKWIGLSSESQLKAWENAWKHISRKMLKKLEW
jgi:hypothetical protein